MRRRDSARLLILNGDGHLLLFHFVFKAGPMAGLAFWATPGGGLDDGETFEQAAVRELLEETGIRVDQVAPPIGQREFTFEAPPSGEWVISEERFFLIDAGDVALSRDGWTELEVEVMAEHKWWSRDELVRTEAKVYPEDLREMLAGTRFR